MQIYCILHTQVNRFLHMYRSINHGWVQGGGMGLMEVDKCLYIFKVVLDICIETLYNYIRHVYSANN